MQNVKFNLSMQKKRKVSTSEEESKFLSDINSPKNHSSYGKDHLIISYKSIVLASPARSTIVSGSMIGVSTMLPNTLSTLVDEELAKEQKSVRLMKRISAFAQTHSNLFQKKLHFVNVIEDKKVRAAESQRMLSISQMNSPNNQTRSGWESLTQIMGSPGSVQKGEFRDEISKYQC